MEIHIVQSTYISHSPTKFLWMPYVEEHKG